MQGEPEAGGEERRDEAHQQYVVRCPAPAGRDYVLLPEALADLRERVLAPLDGLRPSATEKLAETLRLWLLLQGRRDEVAAALFVHPQTVRYRMGQLREAFGDRLDDPETVLALTVALGVSP